MEIANTVEERVVQVEESASEPRAKRDRKKVAPDSVQCILLNYLLTSSNNTFYYQTEVFVVEVSSKESKEFSVPAGKGCTLGSIAACKSLQPLIIYTSVSHLFCDIILS